MASLLPLREEIRRGDLRALAWPGTMTRAWSHPCRLANRLRQRFHQAGQQAPPAPVPTDAQGRRTASELWPIRETLAQEETRRQAATAHDRHANHALIFSI